VDDFFDGFQIVYLFEVYFGPIISFSLPIFRCTGASPVHQPYERVFSLITNEKKVLFYLLD
jgi:hypothetical protein